MGRVTTSVKHPPAEDALSGRKGDIGECENTSTQHGGRIWKRLETESVVVCTAVLQRHARCAARAFLPSVPTLAFARLTCLLK